MRKRIGVVQCLVTALIALSFVGPSAAEWKDPSDHAVRFVSVDHGVKLEVLDWRGSGDPVLLLAGHGDTGHIFDDFAPLLAPHFHVFAMTRRGFGASSQPKDGYDLRTLVNDIARVIDALHLRRVSLVGHSIAGDEITKFAIIYPEKLDTLVYLDAAYDRVEAQKLEAQFPELAPSPRESGTPKEIQALVAKTEILMPESEIRATRVFGPDGQFLRNVTPDWISHAVGLMVEHPHYEAIRAPMLAIYSVYQTPAQILPRYNSASREDQRNIETILKMFQPFAQAQRDLFRKNAHQARVAEIPGASHYVFLSNKQEVSREILSFLNTHLSAPASRD
jgi:pimeloyl-ACP methyl ester carboxylesterase